MNRLGPYRFIGYILGFLLWLVVMLAPCAAITLALRGEINWQRNEYDGDRVWLIQERDQRGLGYSAVRLVGDERPTDGPVCVQTTVRFLLWEGSAEGQDTEYCECYGIDGSLIEVCQ
ncbi:MAG: hypothetical protein AAB427_13770 [Chloroflexota bacterium]